MFHKSKYYSFAHLFEQEGFVDNSGNVPEYGDNCTDMNYPKSTIRYYENHPTAWDEYIRKIEKFVDEIETEIEGDVNFGQW